MNRRDLLILGSTAIAWPLAASAQQKVMPVIGVLGVVSPDSAAAQQNLAAFHRGLGGFGYVEGQNVAIEYRWAEGHYGRLPALAADLAADSDGSRPGFRDDLAHHSDLMSLGVPR